MIKKLIVPVDFSSNSRQAFSYALGLAKDLKAGIELYHAWTAPFIVREFSADARKAAHTKDQDKKVRLLENFKKQAEDEKVKCRYTMNEDTLFNGVNELATQDSMIVMGTKGETGLDTLFMGSMTSRMIMDANVPVLSVPKKARYTGINNVMLGIDYEKEFHWNFRKVQTILAKKASVKVVHIEIGEYSSPYEKEMMADISKTIRSDFKGFPSEFIEIHDEDIIEGLNKGVKKLKPDVVVLLTSKKSLVERIFWGSLAKRMALVTKVPLLTIPVKVSQ